MKGQRSSGSGVQRPPCALLSKTSHLQECNVLLWVFFFFFGSECTLGSGQDACLFWPTVRQRYKGMIHVRFTWHHGWMKTGRLALHFFLSLKASVLRRAGRGLPRSTPLWSLSNKTRTILNILFCLLRTADEGPARGTNPLLFMNYSMCLDGFPLQRSRSAKKKQLSFALLRTCPRQ